MIRNRRFFLRPIADVEAGGQTSLHSRITLKGKKLRGVIAIRDCENEISLEFWTGEGARPGGRERCAALIEKLQVELDAFAAAYDKAAKDL